MLPRVFLLILTLTVMAGAAWRWNFLSSRPLHADEAVQAWQTWKLLRGDGYEYDPVDRHGPWLYYGAAAWTKLRGGNAATLDDAGVRSFSWLAGVLTLVVLAFFCWRMLSPLTAVFATAFLATEPFAVLYHTYFVQEPWLALFTWALAFTALAYVHRPGWPLACAIGALVGMMQVTKETAAIHYAALAIGLAITVGRRSSRRSHRRAAEAPAGSAGTEARCSVGDVDERPHHFRNAGVALLVALGIYAAFYSSFGSNPHGLVDGVTTYLHQFRRSGDATHAHPFSHYASLLWPHRSGGVRWGLLPLLLAAAVGLIAAARPAAPRALQLTAAVSVLLFLLYSLIPYKTPWLLLTPLLGVAVLAGAGLAALGYGKRWHQLLAAGTACVIVVHLVGQTRLALERYPGDARNPYFYQQTPRGFSALPRRLAELASFDPQIAVVSPDFAWPLPWYLRNEDKVAYFSEPPANLQDFDAWVWDSQLPAPDAWPDGAMIELHGARPNVLLQLVVRPELRQQWESTVR